MLPGVAAYLKNGTNWAISFAGGTASTLSAMDPRPMCRLSNGRHTASTPKNL